MKDKAFAKAVSRDDLRRGAEELGLPLDEHIGNVIRFLRERAEALGLQWHVVSAQRTARSRFESSLASFVPSRRVMVTEH